MGKMICLILVVLFFFNLSVSKAAEKPCLLLSKTEALQIKSALGKYPLLDKTFNRMKTEIDAVISQPLEVPPPGEAGGYEHERHKQNYREMQMTGALFQITGDEKYAIFVRDMLRKYAELYPTLGAHPLAYNQAPGKLFHQTLNEEVWLVYVAQAYDCIYNWLSAADRANFEKNIFRPMAEWFSVRNANEFDRIHNHGTWATAAVGMIGYVLNDRDLVEKALYGTQKTKEGGFLRQLDLLFSPDGYYMEGPYYIRYALTPFFFFAEAIQRNQPEIGIYEYRDQILKKAYYSAVQTAFPNGVFPPINDASKTMDIKAAGVVLANDLVYSNYEPDMRLLSVAKFQNDIFMNGAGLAIAKGMVENHPVPDVSWGSIEFADGFDGKQGGLGILRTGEGFDQSMLLMKYGVHGKGHGHFDKLHFIFYDQHREVMPDYGFSRWINIEPKFGGRYLPENDSYAMQTVAHNTVVVDQVSQNKSSRKEADRVSGLRHFFDAADPDVQVMSALSTDHYPGVNMQRTMFLIRDDAVPYPFVVDLYRLTAAAGHTYDYALHFDGQFITSNWELRAHDSLQVPLGKAFGYQHLWNEAEAAGEESFQFTWLSGKRYYSFLTAAQSGAGVFFARTGAHDPNFNLRSEPAMIFRVPGQKTLFASVIESHGYFNEARERSENARPLFGEVKIIGHNDEGSVVEIALRSGKRWQIMVTNQTADDSRQHSLQFAGQTFNWRGNYQVITPK